MYTIISPHLFVLINLLVAIASFLFFSRYGLHERYFFVPVFLLALIYGIINLTRQKRGLSPFAVRRQIRTVPLLRQAIARYLVWLVVIYLALRFYETHPFYGRFRENITFFSFFFKLYLVAGLPYFVLTLVVKSSRVEDFYDPAVRIIHIIKHTITGIIRRKGLHAILRVFRREYNQKVLLNLIMRCYFIPVMIVQVYVNIDNSIRYSGHNFGGYDFFTICLWITSILWLMDTVNASLSYCIESRWVENRSRSIDLTVGGWLVCLACYPPMNDITGTFFPFGPLVAMRYPESFLFKDMTFMYIFKVVEILLLVAHVYADISLGPSVANITFKRIQTRGPFGMVRHPGTTTKLTLWWFQSALYTEFWRLEFILGHIMWNVIYILRALTEERHLSKFGEYREYMKKVRYRFVPGLI